MIKTKDRYSQISSNTLILTEFIGKGATRECYVHPLDKNKCIKVLQKNKNSKILTQELNNYLMIKGVLGDMIINYDKDTVETDKGVGLVCELLKDDDGKLSKPVRYYIKNGALEKELKEQFDYFVYNLIEHKLFFYDFNLNNFVIQIKKGVKRLKYIDLKSYENNKSWCFLKLEKYISIFAEIIMVRRLKRLYHTLGIKWKN